MKKKNQAFVEYWWCSLIRRSRLFGQITKKQLKKHVPALEGSFAKRQSWIMLTFIYQIIFPSIVQNYFWVNNS